MAIANYPLITFYNIDLLHTPDCKSRAHISCAGYPITFVCTRILCVQVAQCLPSLHLIGSLNSHKGNQLETRWYPSAGRRGVHLETSRVCNYLPYKLGYILFTLQYIYIYIYIYGSIKKYYSEILSSCCTYKNKNIFIYKCVASYILPMCMPIRYDNLGVTQY